MDVSALTAVQLYMFFGAFPIVYQQHRGWSEGIGGLSFLGIAVGIVFGIVYMFPDNARYRRLVAREKPEPETRLPPAMVGAVAIPMGMFWFAWTNGPNCNWLVSVAAQVPFGFGFVLVFLSIQAYLVDAYTIYAASVLASNVLLRSGIGAAFPMFTSVSLCPVINASLISSTCTMGWVCIGHRQFPPLSRWRACRCPLFSISMAHASAGGVAS
jgi:hypothetical protein